MDINELIEMWKSSDSPKMNYYDAIDFLDNCLSEIRSGVTYTEEDLSDLRAVHIFTIIVSMGIEPPYEDFNSLKTRKTFPDLSYLISKYDLPCLSEMNTNEDWEKSRDDIKSNNISGGLGYRNTEQSEVLSDLLKREERLADIRESFNLMKESKNIKFDDWEKDPTLNLSSLVLGLTNTNDILSCYFFIPDIEENESFQRAVIHSSLLKRRENIENIMSIFFPNPETQKPKNQIKRATKLVKTNNNQSNVVFGRTREKMIAEAKKTYYYSTTLTPDRIKEDQAQLISKWAKETVFKADKKVMGYLAVMKRVPKEEQLDLITPLTSSPVGFSDWDTWSIVHSNLKDHIDEKFDIKYLTKSFSISDRQKKENEYSRDFISSIGLLSNTWIIYQYNEGTKEVTFAEPLLSCNLLKERDKITGEEHEYFILTSVCKFYERAEQLNQVMSFDEKLFKIEYYDKDGVLVKLAQTTKNMTLITHLLEHIYKFKYYYENPRKNKDTIEEDDSKRYKKIKFDTLFDLVEVNNRKSKLSYGRKVDGCFQYWKSLNYIDFEIVKKANRRGKSYDYILLKYPEAPEDTPKLSS